MAARNGIGGEWKGLLQKRGEGFLRGERRILLLKKEKLFSKNEYKFFVDFCNRYDMIIS